MLNKQKKIKSISHKTVFEIMILFILGVLFLLFFSREKGFFLQNDSANYINMMNYSGIMPLYPLFLDTVRNIFGESDFLYAVVIIQTIFAVLATLDLLWYIKKHFQLETFSTYVCYLALLLLFEIDYVYAGMTHQIITEGLAYPLFYIYFKYLLKSIWESNDRNSVIHFLLACITSLIRSQMKMLLIISAVIYFYACVRDGFLEKKNRFYCLRGILGAMLIIAFGLSLISVADKTCRKIMYYQPTEMSADGSITKPSIVSNEGQAAGALEFKILYLADEEDRELFENKDIKTIYDIGYRALDEEKKRYVYAEDGYFKWRSMLACSATSQTMDKAYQAYASEHPEWEKNLSVSYGEAKNIITKELLKKHWVHYIENTGVYFIHGLMCSVCFENDEHYNWCYAVMVLAYIGIAIVSMVVACRRNTNKETIELTLITVCVSLLLILMVSTVLFTIRRYVSYSIGMFYLSGYLMVREIWKSMQIKHIHKNRIVSNNEL